MKNKIIPAFLLVVLFSTSLVYARKNDDSAYAPQDYDTMRTAIANQGTSMANMQSQISQITGSLQTLTGDVNRTYKENRDQEKTIADAHNRMQSLEDKMTILTTQLAELQTEGFLKPQASKRLSEYKEYATGLEFVNAAQYDKAVQAMQSFQSKNPKSIYKSFAQFWIGEAYYQQADYQMAIKEFQKLFELNPQSAKAPTALYKQGLSFAQLKSYEDAKAFFANVIRTYPASLEAIQASSQLRRIENVSELNRQQNRELNLVQ